MTFNLVRMGLPNTAAILALAIMPVVALTAAPERRPATIAVEQSEAAAICLPAGECAVIVAATPETVLE
jgi:hypothetical protein